MEYTWQTCPPDILEVITSNLKLHESTQAELVCKHWHSSITGMERQCVGFQLIRAYGQLPPSQCQVDGYKVEGNCSVATHPFWQWLRHRQQTVRHLKLGLHCPDVEEASSLYFAESVMQHLAQALHIPQGPPLVLEAVCLTRHGSDVVLGIVSRAFGALQRPPVQLKALDWLAKGWTEGDAELVRVFDANQQAKLQLDLVVDTDTNVNLTGIEQQLQTLYLRSCSPENVLHNIKSLSQLLSPCTALIRLVLWCISLPDSVLPLAHMHLITLELEGSIFKQVELPASIARVDLRGRYDDFNMLLYGPEEGLPNLSVASANHHALQGTNILELPFKVFVLRGKYHHEDFTAVCKLTQLQELSLRLALFDELPALTVLPNLHTLSMPNFFHDADIDEAWFDILFTALPNLRTVEVESGRKYPRFCAFCKSRGISVKGYAVS